MLFDDTSRRAAATEDFTVSEVADALREHLLSSEDPLSEKTWRIAGYRFARAIAQGRRRGYELTREFTEGMRQFAEEHASIGPPVLYDTRRADAVEEKAEKLLALASHKNTGDAEARAAEHGFVKLYTQRDLAIISAERLNMQGQKMARMEDALNFLKAENPTMFLWASGGKNGSNL